MADVVNNGAVNKTKWGIEADKLNAKFNSIDSDLTTINGRVDGVDSDITTVNGRLDGVDSDITTINGRVDGVDSDLTTLTRAQAIQLLNQQDSSLIFKGFAKPGDAVPAATLNHAYIVTNTGTVFGVEASEGQVLVGNGNGFDVIGNEEQNYTKENKVLCILTSAALYFNNVFKQLIKHGFLFEATSLDLFVNHFDEFRNEYGTLILDSNIVGKLNPVSEVKPQDVVDRLNLWVEENKIVYFNATSSVQCSKNDILGTITSASFISLFKSTNISVSSFDANSNSEFVINSEYADEAILMEPNTKPHQWNYSLNNDNLEVIVYGRQVGIGDKPFIQTDNETFIFVSTGGIVSGNIPISAGYTYADIGYLIKRLWGNHNKFKLAYDMINCKRIVATGVDCDVTNEPESIKLFLDAWGDRPIEFGLVVDKLTDKLAGFYKSTCRNIVSHSYFHGQSIASTIEEHVVPNKPIVLLEKPYRISISSVKDSSNNNVPYRLLYPGLLIIDGSYIGQTITVNYSYHNEPKDWIGSIVELKNRYLLTDNVIYLTGSGSSIHPATYKWAKENGVVICDYINPLERAFYQLQYQHYYKKMIMSYATSFEESRYGVGFDGMFTRPSIESGKDLVYDCIAYNKQHNLPFVWFTHDFFAAEFAYNRIWQDPDSRYPSWWDSMSLQEVRETIMGMMKFWLDTIDDSENCSWMLRSEFCRRYEDIIENITYSSYRSANTETLHISSKKAIDGITFRCYSDVSPRRVTLDGQEIEFTYNEGEVMFSFDSRAGATQIAKIYF